MPMLHIVASSESLDESRYAARATVGRQQRRDDDDAVDGVGAKQLVDGVVGGIQRLRGFHRPAIDQQQMMAGLAALRMNGIAELRFIPTAEGIQVIEQHRDAKPMRPIPVWFIRPSIQGTTRPEVAEGDHRHIADELATGRGRVQ